MDDKLLDALRLLALSVKKTIEEGISNGTIQPEEELYSRWKVDKFQYTDKGIIVSSAREEDIAKPSWLGATLKLRESTKQSSEYCHALEQLTAVFDKSETISRHLENFVWKLIYQSLSESKFGEADIDALITTFLKDLRGEPVKYGAEVELEGIALQPDRVEPDFDITLRQARIEDLEKEFPAYSFMGPHFLPNPSAILNIEFLGRQANEIQRRVEQAIAILRLFRVGSAKWIRYRMYSDSITDVMARGTLTSGERYAALEISLITNEDVQRLKKFWQAMKDSLPRSFYELAAIKADYVTIAYNRYSDALLQNGILERRIANAVMGLEALLLKPGEIQELVYRLSTRISKLLGLLEYDPHEITKIVKDAYRVRNLFVHGGQLSYDEKKKLESKYKDVKNVLLSVLDYLRISIIVMIFSNKEKDEFIDLIDSSLIDRKKEELLNVDISRTKEIIR